MLCMHAVLNAIDERLRMLDANAERERLGLQAQASLEQEFEYIARGMPSCQHHGLGHELTAVTQAYAADAPLVAATLQQQIADLGPKAQLAARGFQALTNRRHQLRQPIAADVRPRLGQ